MDLTEVWAGCFLRWPQDLPRRGILVTHLNDQIPFSDFQASDGMLLVERQTPDSMGARKVLVPYSAIAALKFTDVLKAKVFAPMGFGGQQRASEGSR